MTRACAEETPEIKRWADIPDGSNQEKKSRLLKEGTMRLTISLGEMRAFVLVRENWQLRREQHIHRDGRSWW
jgi:hypothetical protein